MKRADVLFVVRVVDLHLAGSTGDVVPAAVIYLFRIDDLFTGCLGVAGAINLSVWFFADDSHMV
jgi:hypothetical protein